MWASLSSSGISESNLNLWKLNYEYGELNANGTVDANKNTENLAKQTISFDGVSQDVVQTYKYDALYRLIEADENSGSSQNWKQTYGYDKYGNRTAFSQVIGSINLPINSETLPSIDVNTNRFNTSQGYTYDKVGNLVGDAENRTFVFNGDNKQVEVKDASNNVIGTYLYDGDGKRIKKVTADEETVFVYSGGKLVAEYSTDIATTASTKYVATDTLGSIRAMSDQNGDIVSRRDFMPFGEEMYAGTPNRDASQKYSTDGDNVRQKFTGYERDKETGLDFAEARYYKSEHARFTAVDPLIASGKSANPQTFNRYSYVSNNPLAFTDPSGLQQATCPDDPCGERVDAGVVGEVSVADSFSQWLTDVADGTTKFFENLFTRSNPDNVCYGDDCVSRRNPLLERVSGSDPLQNLNMLRFENIMSGRPVESPRLFGIQGPTVDSLLQQTTDSYEAAAKIGEASISVQLLLLGGPAGRTSNPVTTSRGVSVSGSRFSFNPFADKSAKQIDSMFKSKGFTLSGPDPVSGKGGYVNPRSNRSFHIDPKGYGKGKNTSEPNHVDVNRPRGYKGTLKKRKLPFKDN